MEFQKTGPKKYEIIIDNDVVADLSLVSSSITNKFEIVTSFIENISKNCSEFDEWFKMFIEEYMTSDEKFIVIEKNIEKIKKFSDDYIINTRKIEFDKFVDESKAKKNSILFTVDEVSKIIRLSGYLKIYSVISNSDNLKLDNRLHKKIYSLLSSDISPDLTYKIFNIIKTKTFKYSYTDRYMWEYIKTVQCKTIDNHVIEIFNFIMDSILVLCEEDRNPITYFVTVVDESIKWILRSVYKASVVYDDTISTEDVQSANFNNLKTYAYNDTLGRLKGIAFRHIYENLEKNSLVAFDSKSDECIMTLQQRIENVKFISPFCDFLVYPTLSAIADIPYIHLKTLSPEHSIVLSVFLQTLFRKVFDVDYRNLFSMLSYYPKTQPSLITTYKLKNIQQFIATSNSVDNFYGFSTKVLLGEMLGNFVGKISRVDFVNIFDGRELGGIPVSKIEAEMIHFFTLYFAGKIQDKFDTMRNEILMEF